MISPITFQLPGWWRWNRWGAVVLNDFQSPVAVGVGRTAAAAAERCIADYEAQVD